MSGNEFADRFLDQILNQGAEIEIETVTGIRDEGNFKYVLTEDGNEYQCKAVIIASGVKHRMLGIANEYDFVGRGISSVLSATVIFTGTRWLRLQEVGTQPCRKRYCFPRSARKSLYSGLRLFYR
jgi:thioredoxin reductase